MPLCRGGVSAHEIRLEIVLDYCRLTSAGTSGLAEILGRNQDSYSDCLVTHRIEMIQSRIDSLPGLIVICVLGRVLLA
jgi:hypothetical protein